MNGAEVSGTFGESQVIAKQTRHRSMEVLRRYIRDGDLFRENAAGEVGL